MRTDEVVLQQRHVQGALQRVGVLGIGVGSTPKGAVAPAQGRVMCFQMIGVDGRLGNGARGVGMFGLGGLIFRAFGTAPMPLTAFVLEAYPTAFWQRLAGATPLPGPHRLGTQLEQGVPITALPVGEKGDVLGPLHVRGHRAHDLFKQGGVFATALLIHQKPAGPFQEDGRPAGRVRRVNPLADHGVNLIPFKRQWDKGMAQPVEHQGGVHPRKTAFPLGDGVLVGT